MVVAAKFQGDVWAVGRVEQDRDDAAVGAGAVVQDLLDDLAFVSGAQTDAGGFLAVGAAAVGCSADDQDELRVADLALHPLNPAFGREGLVLVEDGVDAVAAEAVG
jgi:hypothetical protein